ncbi:DUF167 domain-containing protein [Candidatus Dojkabacteria bacterium]|nr:DUF167 domain-containing protein [Candidatus Dojkabacteria bacterium]
MNIRIKAITKSSKNSIEKVENPLYDYKLKVTDPPQKGKANDAIIRLLSQYFDTKPQNISIIKGMKNNIKTIEIVDD